jgi:hypothetical protein
MQDPNGRTQTGCGASWVNSNTRRELTACCHAKIVPQGAICSKYDATQQSLTLAFCQWQLPAFGRGDWSRRLEAVECLLGGFSNPNG